MLLRVRSKNGTWRVPQLSAQSTIEDVKRWIEREHSIAYRQQELSLDAHATTSARNDQTLQSLGLGHGDMLFLEYDGDLVSTGGTVGTKIAADGTLTLVTYDESSTKRSFRPGLKALRDMKMHWTLGEFMDMDAQFEYKISAQKAPHVAKLNLDGASCNNFQSYLRQFAFQQSRCGWLYGTVDSESKEVTVDWIYEPPQQGDPYGFEVLDDPNADRVDAIATALGRERVGWVFSHPPREDEAFHFSAREILMAAQLQLDAGGAGSLFVTLKCTLDKQGQASFEAFQVSDQCVEMFEAGVLLDSESDPKVCAVHPTFTALVEARPSPSIDTNFFLCVVPVATHDSGFTSEFPMLNREDSPRTRAALKQHLDRHRNEPYVDRLRDFQLLVFLADFLDAEHDLPAICASIRDDSHEFGSGYQLLIDSVAGAQ